VDIHFVSALSPEDEHRLAEAVVASAAALLDQWPIAYALRVETGLGQFERHGNGRRGEALLDVATCARH
jgi:hypothetical protein